MGEKFTEGPFETMGNMPESICKKNDDGSLRWGCRVIPAVLDGSAEDDDARRQECAGVATLFRASPVLYEALKSVEWNMEDPHGKAVCPCCFQRKGNGHDSDCELNNALRAARGEK